MCMQCAMGVMTAGAAATGTRAYLAIRSPRWLTPARMRAATITLLGIAVLVAATLVPGPG